MAIPPEQGFLLPPHRLSWAVKRSARRCWKGERAGLELGTLAAFQVPLLMFSVIWTNYLPLWRVQFLHLLFEGWGGPNDGFHTPFTFLPGEVLHGTSMQKAELLVEVGIASHSSIHPAFLAQPLPGIPWTLGGTLGYRGTQFENHGLRSQKSLPTFGLEESMPAELKSQGLPLAGSREPDSILGRGGGIISAGRRNP